MCDLIVNSDIDCLNEDSFLVTVDIAGSDTYTIEDNYGNMQTGVSAGQLFLGPYPNGAFNITITSGKRYRLR